MNKKIMLGMLSTLTIPIIIVAAVSCGQTSGQPGGNTSEKDKTKMTETPVTMTPATEVEKPRTNTTAPGSSMEMKPETPKAGATSPGTIPTPGETSSGASGSGTVMPAQNSGTSTDSGSATATPTAPKAIGRQSSSISFENVNWDLLKDIPLNTFFELVYVPEANKYSITYKGAIISENSPHGTVLSSITNSKGEQNKFDAFITQREGQKFLVANFKTPANREEFVEALDLS